MTFQDLKLKEHCERTAAVLTDCPPEQRPVVGLFDAWYWFHLVEGEGSPRAAEAVEHLLSAELRPALRQLYKRWWNDMNEGALRFRDRLSELAGESFG